MQSKRQIIIKDLDKDESSSLGLTTYGNVLYPPDAKMYENVELIYTGFQDYCRSDRAAITDVPDYRYYEFTAISLESKSVVYCKNKRGYNLFVREIELSNICPNDRIIVKAIFSTPGEFAFWDEDKYDMVMERLINFDHLNSDENFHN